MKLKKISVFFLAILMFLAIENTISYAGVNEKFDFNSNLPNYYTSEWLNTVNTKVKKASNKGVTSFVFLTDTHLRHNSGYSPALIRNIKKQAKVDFVMNGGDACSIDQTTGKPRYELLQICKDNVAKETGYFEKFTSSLTSNKIKAYYIKGNHDFIVNNTSNVNISSRIAPSETYKKIMDTMKNNKVNNPNGKLYYYFDDTENKIRYITLDVFENDDVDEGYCSNEQIEWFYERLKEVSDYKIVIFSHAPVNKKISSDSSKQIYFIQEIEEAYNNCKKATVKVNSKKKTFDFTDNTNLILAHFAGHTHRDKSDFSNNVLSIVTTSDYYAGKRDNDMWDRKQKTTSEQAFDYVTIDINNNKTYATRVGAGKDREWSFPTKNISKCKFSGIKTSYYNSKGTTLSDLSILDGNKKLTKDKDYTVTYKNNKAEGIATVTIKGQGTYTGTFNKNFRIIKNGNVDTSKEYYITSAQINGRALDGANKKGANIVSKTLSCGDTQRFKFIKNSDGSYYIQNVKSAYCVAVTGGKTATAKTTVSLNDKANENAQKWYAGQNADGTISFYTIYGLPMEVAGEKNNLNVQINTFSNSNVQKFKMFDTKQISANTIDTSKVYYIVSSINNKKAIDVYAGGTKDFSNVDIYDLNKTNAQKFKFEKNSDGSYTIINVGSNKALDIYANGTADKSNVDIYTSNKTPAQKWYCIKNSDGTITFIGAESGRALDLYAGKVDNMTNIDIWNWNQSNAQKWKLIQ